MHGSTNLDNDAQMRGVSKVARTVGLRKQLGQEVEASEACLYRRLVKHLQQRPVQRISVDMLAQRQ